MQFVMEDTEDVEESSDPILNVDALDSLELLKEVELKIFQDLRRQASNKRKSRLETIFKGGKRKFMHEQAYYEELCSGENFQVISFSKICRYNVIQITVMVHIICIVFYPGCYL